MDSPKPSSKSTTTPAETVAAQDSPVFSFISNLSPIQPVKAPPATQGFPGLNSPPLVFTSPRINPHSQATFLKRPKFPGLSAAKLSGQDDDASETLVTQMGTRLTNCIEKASYSNNTLNDQVESPTGCSEQFLTDIVNMDFAVSDISPDSTKNKSENIGQPPDSVNSTREIEKVQKEDTSIDVSAVEIDIKQEDSIEPELPIDHALTNHDQKDSSMAENVEMEQASLLDKSCYLISGSKQINKEDENFVVSCEAVSTEQVVEKEKSDSKALQHRGIRRRCLQFEDAQRGVLSNQPVQNTLDSEGPTPQFFETQPIPINENMNSAIKIPKPSGIGLHLNSIVNSVQAGSGATINVKSAKRCTISIRGKSKISANTDDDKSESHASMEANFSTSLSIYVAKPSNKSVIINPVMDQSSPGNKRKHDPESDAVSVEFKPSSNKKRKKSSDSGDGDGCKRCNCKKSKCLKLYCDCFAAGIYCGDNCSCQGCYNKPNYEDIVLETRQQIESRNPLAFAPKVVQQIVEPHASSFGDDVTHFTPASARHKRGCNCKKSMCLKKYCECYQANVGCSDGCRCEGCKNVFGKKGEYGIMNEEDTSEQTGGSFVEKMAESGIELYNTELFNPHNLTPLTPALQFSNHGKDASKAWSHSGKCFKSPDSELSYVAPYMMSSGSPRNSDNNAIVSGNCNEIMDKISFGQVYDNTEKGHHYSIPNPHERENNSKTQFFTGDKHLYWRGSPNTPVGGSKLVQDSEFDTDFSNLMQDDTPEILKDDPAPVNSVKVSSPNKKRVSPPHNRPLNFSSSLSAGVRTGRKFILKAVPSFPPLTPCIDSKNDSQNCSGKK